MLDSFGGFFTSKYRQTKRSTSWRHKSALSQVRSTIPISLRWTERDRWRSFRLQTQSPASLWLFGWLAALLQCDRSLPSPAYPACDRRHRPVLVPPSARCAKTDPAVGGSHSNKQNNNLRWPRRPVELAAASCCPPAPHVTMKFLCCRSPFGQRHKCFIFKSPLEPVQIV